MGDPGPADYDGYSGYDPPETQQQPEQRREPLDRDVEQPKPVTIGELINTHPRLRQPVIDGLLRRGETANIIADPKRGKSWLAYGLALSICTGRDWLNTFATTAGRVLLIDNELHPETIAHRIPVVADAMGIKANEYLDRMDVLYLRGRLTDFYGIGRIVQRIKDGRYVAMIIDAYYRALPQGVSENDNAQIAGIYNLIDNYADQMDCAVLLIHHATKGSQAEKSVTDVGSGAGSQARAADTHLVLREHEDDGYVVLDAALRSFPPVNPMVLQWAFPLWIPQANMDVKALRGRLTKSEQRQVNKDRKGMLDVIDVLQNWNTEADGQATPNRITDKSPFGRDRSRNLLAKLLHAGEVTRQSITINHNKTHEYQLADDTDL